MTGKLPFVVLTLFLTACGGKENPVLPTTPTPDPAGQITVTVTSDASVVHAGAAATPLRVTARNADGTALPDGTSVTINTSLGSFGTNADGTPMRLTHATLAAGAAQVSFLPGPDTGIANILAQVGTSVGRLNLTIMAAPVLPVADFTFSANALTVLFSDASTGGTPTTRHWDFGDGTTSTETSPTHTYALPRTYTVVLTLTNAAGQSAKSRFVTVSLGTPPHAAFDFDVSVRTAHFVDRSTDAATWFWNFGDGSSSTGRNPIHEYAAFGTYTVELTVTNAAGSDSISRVVEVKAGTPPEAEFTFQVAGRTVNFADQSKGGVTGWAWDFGDGTTSNVQNPIHTYARGGNYTVVLQVVNAFFSSTASHIVTIAAEAPPQPAFEFTVTGFQANFLDRSTGGPTAWLWSFGDGTTSTQQNPVHIYSAAGTYTATLTASNSAGGASVSHAVTIVAPTPPQADFDVAVAGLRATFVDRSTGAPSNYEWNFGDGTSSTAQNPVHTYTAAGTYTVTLTVSNAAGSTSAAKAVTVTAPAPPQADFDYTVTGRRVNFVDRSTGSPTSRLWDFGDGVTSTELNPIHDYPATGAYTVTLTVQNAAGSTSKSKVVSTTGGS